VTDAAPGVATAAPEQILSGVRIVDLSWGLAGPVATQLLAEAGADVVKVEPPGGDPMRSWHPSAFATWNRSKRGTVLDLHVAEDAAALRSLLGTADVLVHGLRPGTALRHGLDDDTLLRDHPRLVVCSIGGWPAGHGDAERPGYDLLVQAREGLMDQQSGWRPGPFAWRFPAPSWGAGFLAAAGILARLMHRDATGIGGAAHTSLAQGLHLFQGLLWSRSERPSPSLLEGLPGTLTSTQTAMYECGDGRWLQILNPADRIDLSALPLMRATLRGLGRGEEPFTADLMRAAMRRHPAAAWLTAIRAADVAVELIAPLGAVFTEPEVLANDFVVSVEDPDLGVLRQAAPPFRTEPPSVVRGPAPGLGQRGQAPPGWLLPPLAPDVAAAGHRSGRPLEALRVVDFGAFLAGPLALMLLADLGAEVIKVEPVTGDPVRGWRDGFFVACNRGKRGLALDLSRPESADVRDRLIAWADVVAHNIRPRAAARMGLDEASVRAINPQAVVSTTTAYGTRGPRADWPGYDSVFQAMAGWPNETAGEGNPPLFIHLGTLDVLTAAASTVATLLQLYRRARTGRPGATATALLNTATFSSSETYLDEHGVLAPYPRLDGDQTGLGSGYRIHRTADGWLAVVAPGESSLARLRSVAGLAPDAGAEALAAALGSRRGSDVAAALDRAGVAAEVVRESHWHAVWDDPENRCTGLVVSYPQRDWGEMQQFGAFWNFADLSLRLDQACPSVGQHTAAILADLGVEGPQAEELARSGVVAGPRLPEAT
jgi:crotonobetainyl-CoA:carnitine CoA-transferase CaiB-like acyl-CoA transferase